MKKERFKRKMSVFLGCAMLVAGLGGCRPADDSKEKAVTLKWYIPNDELEDMDMVLEEFNKKLYKKAGLKLQLETIDSDYYSEKMNMKISAGDEFDLWFVGYLNPYEQMIEKGYLYDITEMVEKSELKEKIPDYVWQNAKKNGSIYAVPNYQVLFEQRSVVVRADLLDKYEFDLSAVKKTEDLEPFLQMMQKEEPGLYPFRINHHEYSFWSMDDTYFWDEINKCHLWVDEEGNLSCVPFYENERCVERIYKLRDWYQKGYIRKDIASVSSDAEDYSNKMYAAAGNHYKPGGLIENEKTHGIEVKEAIISEPYIFRNAANATMIGINKNSEHPEDAFKFIEIINTDKELYNMLVFGLEGVHYEKKDDETIAVKEDCSYVIQAWKIGNQFNSYFVEGQSKDDWELTIKLNEEAGKSPFIGFFMDNENIKREIIEISKISYKYKVMYTGAEDPAVYWDEMIKEYKAAGIDRVCEEVRMQAQAFLDSKKGN